MRAIQVREFGGPEVLEQAVLVEPHAGPGELLVHVTGAGVNYADTHQVENSYLSGTDLPFVIDSHDVPGKPARGQPAHVHHDLQYLFLADPAAPLVAQIEEVHAAAWKPLAELAEIAPLGLARIRDLRPQR